MTTGRPNPHELLSAYHDGELNAAEAEAVTRLLEESADARDELEDYRSLSELFRSLPAEQTPAGLKAAVLDRIERERRPAASHAPARVGRTRLGRGLLLITGLATVAAGLLVAVSLLDDRRPPARGREMAGKTVADPSAARDGAAALPREDVTDFSGTPAAEGASAGGVEAARGEVRLADEAEEFGTAVAGVEARPPVDVSVGDVYSYLEQTADGEVVVVVATVVDVRDAVDQVQFLLSRNSIPTVEAAFGDEETEARAALTSRNDDLAVFVESDPSRMNDALAALGMKSGLFESLQLEGILETPVALAGQTSEFSLRLDLGSDMPRRGNAGGTVAETLGELAPQEAVRPQARDSVPAERFAREPSAPAPTAAESLGRPAPEPDAAKPPSLATTADADAALPADAPTTYAFSNYQTILNVSKPELEQQLQQQLVTKAAAGDVRLHYFAGSEEDGTRGTTRERSESDTRQIMAKQAQRRLRLLVVFESQTVKAKADVLARPPVEAPQPVRKKG